jgi:hypothetical protein
VLEWHFGDPLKIFEVLGIRQRIPAFDEVESEFIQTGGDE